MIVVDTNLIAYFVIKSEHSSAAEKVFGADSEWSAPFLWRSEMRNLLTIYLRRQEMTLAEASVAMENAVESVAGREYDVESNRVLELSDISGCTAYDCEFVFLAERLGVPLITSDKKLLAAFPEVTRSMQAFTAEDR